MENVVGCDSAFGDVVGEVVETGVVGEGVTTEDGERVVVVEATAWASSMPIAIHTFRRAAAAAADIQVYARSPSSSTLGAASRVTAI